MLYSPTGVGKTWLSLAIPMIAAGRGKMDLLDWENKDPQPVSYIDGEMLEGLGWLEIEPSRSGRLRTE